MGSGASTAIPVAVATASLAELQDLSQGLSTADKNKIAYALAWNKLLRVMDKDKHLVAEMAAISKPPPGVSLLEQVLCKLCFVAGVPAEAPDWHVTARLTLYKPTSAVIVAKYEEGKQKTFIEELTKINAAAGSKVIADILADFAGRADSLPEHISKKCTLFGHVAMWLHALYGYSACAEPGLFAKQALAEAWGKMMNKLASDKYLVAEIGGLLQPPPEIVLVEEVLCKLCSVAPVPPNSPDWHLSARMSLYRPPDDISAEVDDDMQKTFLTMLRKIHARAGSDDFAIGPFDLVADPRCTTEELKKQSLLFQYVSAWLHALRAYSLPAEI